MAEDYLLGVNQLELERLRFQHGVWSGVTNAFLNRIGVGQGMNVLDVGAGPGFLSMDLRDRVGPTGSVTALEPSEAYLEYLREQVVERGWTNVNFISGKVEEADLPKDHYDHIHVRWVIGFVPDPYHFVERLTSSLKPGGVIALQDYAYEGLDIYPRGGAFEMAGDAIRAYWRSGGGDPYVATELPRIFRELGLEMIDFHPNCLAGGPNSPIIEWAHRFFNMHRQPMVDRGILTQDESDALWADWLEHRKNPDALFFSPICCDVAGKKPLDNR
jgi:ubiquinone/menaquinone biosynthesis C-methylase UbiE